MVKETPPVGGGELGFEETSLQQPLEIGQFPISISAAEKACYSCVAMSRRGGTARSAEHFYLPLENALTRSRL